MYREIGMVGRDKILDRQIYPRCQGKEAAFLLTGHRGIGKTAILEWAFEHGRKPKAYVSASWSMGEVFKAIARDWELEITDGNKKVAVSRAKNAVLESAILKQTEGSIYVDDIQGATPTFLRRFKVWRERFRIYCAGVPPFKKEELKRNLWGLEKITIGPLAKKDRLTLAQKACEFYGSRETPSDVAHSSLGYPGKIMSMAQGTVEIKAERVEGEELDLSPLLLVLIVGIAALRYVGKGMEDTALFLMGGIGIAIMMMLRFFLNKGMK